MAVGLAQPGTSQADLGEWPSRCVEANHQLGPCALKPVETELCGLQPSQISKTPNLVESDV